MGHFGFTPPSLSGVFDQVHQVDHLGFGEVSPAIVCYAIDSEIHNSDSRKGFYGVSQIFAHTADLTVESLREDDRKCGVIDFFDFTWSGHGV